MVLKQENREGLRGQENCFTESFTVCWLIDLMIKETISQQLWPFSSKRFSQSFQYLFVIVLVYCYSMGIGLNYNFLMSEKQITKKQKQIVVLSQDHDLDCSISMFNRHQI